MRHCHAALLAGAIALCSGVSAAGDDANLRGSLGHARVNKVEPVGAAQSPLEITVPVGETMPPMRGVLATHARRPAVEGLRWAMQSAVRSSAALRAAYSEEKAADFGVWREIASFTPQITASAERNWAQGGGLGSIEDSSFADLKLYLPIFTSGERIHKVATARGIARAAHFRTATVRDNVMVQTAEAYMQQIYAVRALEALERNETMLRRLLASLKAQHESGFASAADVAEVDAELGAARNQIVDSNVMLRKARDKTNSLAGRPVAARLDFPQMDRALAAGRETLRVSAMRRNPNVLAAAANAAASKSNSHAMVSRYLPQVGLNVGYRQMIGEIKDGGDRERMSVGLKLTVPLVDLSTVASIGESKERAAADRYRVQDTVRLISDQLVDLWSEREGNIERVDLTAKRVADLRRVAEAAEARFRKGLIGLDMLLDSQRRLTAAEVEQAQLAAQTALTDVQVLVTAGIFSPAMITD